MGILIVVVIALAVVAGLVFAIAVARAAHRPHPALPTSCGDCVFMVPRAKIYKRETLEDEDGLVHYLWPAALDRDHPGLAAVLPRAQQDPGDDDPGVVRSTVWSGDVPPSPANRTGPVRRLRSSRAHAGRDLP